MIEFDEILLDSMVFTFSLDSGRKSGRKSIFEVVFTVRSNRSVCVCFQLSSRQQLSRHFVIVVIVVIVGIVLSPDLANTPSLENFTF